MKKNRITKNVTESIARLQEDAQQSAKKMSAFAIPGGQYRAGEAFNVGQSYDTANGELARPVDTPAVRILAGIQFRKKTDKAEVERRIDSEIYYASEVRMKEANDRMARERQQFKKQIRLLLEALALEQRRHLADIEEFAARDPKEMGMAMDRARDI